MWRWIIRPGQLHLGLQIFYIYFARFVWKLTNISGKYLQIFTQQEKDLLHLVTFSYKIVVQCPFQWGSYKDGAKNFWALVYKCKCSKPTLRFSNIGAVLLEIFVFSAEVSHFWWIKFSKVSGHFYLSCQWQLTPGTSQVTRKCINVGFWVFY